MIRDRNQVHDTQGEAQNISDGNRPGVSSHDRHKATEGIRQGRDDQDRYDNLNRRSGISRNK